MGTENYGRIFSFIFRSWDDRRCRSNVYVYGLFNDNGGGVGRVATILHTVPSLKPRESAKLILAKIAVVSPVCMKH